MAPGTSPRSRVPPWRMSAHFRSPAFAGYVTSSASVLHDLRVALVAGLLRTSLPTAAGLVVVGEVVAPQARRDLRRARAAALAAGGTGLMGAHRVAPR